MGDKKDKEYEIQAGLTAEFGKQVKYLKSIDEKITELPGRIKEEIVKGRD